MRVLVPISEDTASQRAVPEAVRLAGEQGEVVLASVGELPEVSEHEEDIRDALSKRLANVARGVTSVPVHTRIELAGDPVRGLAAIAREERVDMVLLTDEEGEVSAALRKDLAEDSRPRVPVTVVGARR